jgi:hypothetical protein
LSAHEKRRVLVKRGVNSMTFLILNLKAHK